MAPTRRFWAAVLLWGFSAIYAVLLTTPLTLICVSGVSAWLLIMFARLVHQITTTADHLHVETTLPRPRAAIDEELQLTVQVALDRPCPAAVAITAELPLPASEVAPEERTLHLEPGTTSAETAVSFHVPVAGRFEVPSPTVEYTDSGGLVTETVPIEETTTLTVEPPYPRALHVGQGGERIATTYGEHPTGHAGSGLLPAELRQYVPGDTADQIDWKATARLGSPYVREFEAETDRETVLICDHRATMGTGSPGETMLDYTREVALEFCDGAKQHSDPLGLYTIGEEGITTRHDPSTAPDGYRSIRTQLLELTPMKSETNRRDVEGAAPVRVSHPRTAARHLTGETTAFAARLRPYLTTTHAYAKRLEGEPLFEAIRRHQHRRSETMWTVILTNDLNRNQLREAVDFASSDGNHVLVFLTPQVLFEQDALIDLERAYERYVEFEDFRRELNRLPRVSAFEVGPGDRLEAVLATGQMDRPARRS